MTRRQRRRIAALGFWLAFVLAIALPGLALGQPVAVAFGVPLAMIALLTLPSLALIGVSRWIDRGE